MKKTVFATAALALGAMSAAFAQSAPTKVGVINIQGAIIGTKEGQAAAETLQKKFTPKKAELDKKQAEIQNLQGQLSKGSATLSDDAKQKLMREIDQRTKALNRDTEDAQAELQQEEGKIMQDLGGKMMAVINKYGADNGFAVILDISNPQTPVIFAATAVEITKDIVELYDKSAAAMGAGSAAPAATTPAAPKPAAPKPAAPATKK